MYFMPTQNTEIRREEIGDKQRKDENKIDPLIIIEKLKDNASDDTRMHVDKLRIGNQELLVLVIKLPNDKLILPAKVKVHKEKDRIKTTIGFDRETYTMLKALSIATDESMQDIIAKALREYFEKEDVRRILATYFASASFKSTGFKSSGPTPFK